MEEFLKKLAERLGLKEDATEEQILDEMTKKFTEPAPKPGDPPAPKEREDVVTFSELSDAFGLPKESSKEDLLEKAKSIRPPEGQRMRQLQKQFPEEYKILEETRKDLAKEQLGRRLAEWHRGGDFGGIPPSLDEIIGDVRGLLSPSGRTKFDDFIGELLEVGLVMSAELGSTPLVLGDEQEEFTVALAAVRKNDPKLSLEEAVRETAKQNPQLAEAYRKATQRIEVEAGG
jgi:hypothetical protein